MNVEIARLVLDFEADRAYGWIGTASFARSAAPTSRGHGGEDRCEIDVYWTGRERVPADVRRRRNTSGSAANSQVTFPGSPPGVWQLQPESSMLVDFGLPPVPAPLLVEAPPAPVPLLVEVEASPLLALPPVPEPAPPVPAPLPALLLPPLPEPAPLLALLPPLPAELLPPVPAALPLAELLPPVPAALLPPVPVLVLPPPPAPPLPPASGDAMQTPAWHVPPAHGAPSILVGSEQAPVAWSHVPTSWHSSDAVHVTPRQWSTPTHTPPVHTSPAVLASPSSHAVPSASAGYEHAPVAPSHVAPVAVWHASGGALHRTGLLPVHTPPWHVSVCVHASPSSHDAPLALAGYEQAPVAPSHVAPVAVWHASGGEAQITGLDPSHTPPWHVSVWVHALPSSHDVPLALMG
jgi:hypothetical protein